MPAAGCCAVWVMVREAPCAGMACVWVMVVAGAEVGIGVGATVGRVVGAIVGGGGLVGATVGTVVCADVRVGWVTSVTALVANVITGVMTVVGVEALRISANAPNIKPMIKVPNPITPHGSR